MLDSIEKRLRISNNVKKRMVNEMLNFIERLKYTGTDECFRKMVEDDPLFSRLRKRLHNKGNQNSNIAESQTDCPSSLCTTGNNNFVAANAKKYNNINDKGSDNDPNDMLPNSLYENPQELSEFFERVPGISCHGTSLPQKK